MKNLHVLAVILCGFMMATFILFLTAPCCAQLSQFYNPYIATFPLGFNPFYPSYNPFLPFFSPLPAFGIPILNPVMSPLIATPPSVSRSAATTIIILPQAPASTVTAYAPLGTLNLTPSTLVFLILFLTLHE